MSAPAQVETLLYEHVIGTGNPMGNLLNTGVLSADWVERYLALLQESQRQWKEQPRWPRELVAAVHIASWYLHLRYQTWSGLTKKRNETTEALLARVRSQSEIFLLSPVCDMTKTIAEQGGCTEHGDNASVPSGTSVAPGR